VLDNIPRYSQHSVNTERVVTSSKGMKHEEGGWPKDIDYTETTETAKWRTRHLKDSLLAAAVKRLAEMT